MRKPVSVFPTRSDVNRAVQPQEMARGLKFRIYEVESQQAKNIGPIWAPYG